MKLKTYIALSVWLNKVPAKHASGNGGKQFTILCRAKSQKEVAAIFGGTLSHLRNFSGIREAPERLGFNLNEVVSEIVKKDRTIYYKVEHCRSGYVNEWFEYKP